MSTEGNRARRRVRYRGFSLVETAIFIAVVGIGLAGVLLAITTATRDSVDPLIRKQAVAIAESLLQEITSMPYTYCDPDDPAARTAANTAACAVLEALGPEAGETRYGPATPFDNVNDYHGYNTATEVPPGIKDINGTLITGLSGYNAAVTVTPVVLSAATALLVTVTVTGPRNTVVNVDGYRAQYAPNAVP